MSPVDALITAGGKGTRMKDVAGEKPLLPVLGVPMIDRVVEALRRSGQFEVIYASVSSNAPMTRDHLREMEVAVIETSGAGYVADLGEAMRHMNGQEVLVCPADMPLLTGRGVQDIVSAYQRSGVASMSVAASASVVRHLGVAPSFSLEVEGREVVLCGVSVVDRRKMLTEEMLSQGYMVTDDEQFALNVNTREELAIAERLLVDRRS